MGSIGTRQDQMNVPYEEWGREINRFSDESDLGFDERGFHIGYISDETEYDSVPDIRKATKKDVLNDIEGWKMDDGTYGTGTGDEAIYVAYNDGRFLDLTDGDAHNRWSKSGIVGLSVSTGDYQMVWGGELNKRTGEVEPWTTNEFDENSNQIAGYTNSYSGRKSTKKRLVRTKVTFNNYDEKHDRYVMKREVIRRSTWKNLER